MYNILQYSCYSLVVNDIENYPKQFNFSKVTAFKASNWLEKSPFKDFFQFFWQIYISYIVEKVFEEHLSL